MLVRFLGFVTMEDTTYAPGDTAELNGADAAWLIAIGKATFNVWSEPEPEPEPIPEPAPAPKPKAKRGKTQKL